MSVSKLCRRLRAIGATLLCLSLILPASGLAAQQRHRHGARHRGLRRATTGTCPGATLDATQASRQALRDAVVCLVNQQRARFGLPPLHEARSLNRSAQGWSDAMVHAGVFSHGADFSARITAAGYDWSDAGENIATGFPTALDVVRGWMASTGHCQNILAANYADVGTGVNAHPLGSFAPATWTEDFGLWMGHRAPSGDGGPARGCPYRI
jgi:uncharacterized protein YkwD